MNVLEILDKHLKIHTRKCSVSSKNAKEYSIHYLGNFVWKGFINVQKESEQLYKVTEELQESIQLLPSNKNQRFINIPVQTKMSF